MKHTITIQEVEKFARNGITTFNRKNKSPRGCETVSANEIKVGDKIIINNYITTVTENQD